MSDIMAETTSLSAVPNKYRLYVSKSCPFAHRPRMLRVLLGLENEVAVSGSVGQDETGFFFDPTEPEFGCKHLKDVYKEIIERNLFPPVEKYTVPLLIDRETKAGVSNESLELCWFMVSLYHAKSSAQNDSFEKEGKIPVAPGIWLKLPANEEEEQEERKKMEDLSANVTLTPYRFLFAQDADSKEQMREKIHSEFSKWNEVLDETAFLGGKNTLSMADCVLWPSLLRFDNVYTRQFGLTGKTIKEDFPNLMKYVRAIYHIQRIREDAELDSVVKMYWQSVSLSKMAGNDPLVEVPEVIEI
jgi:putative glutathione S-transferase